MSSIRCLQDFADPDVFQSELFCSLRKETLPLYMSFKKKKLFALKTHFFAEQLKLHQFSFDTLTDYSARCI